MDGAALIRFTRTLLYYYCTERYERCFSAENVWLKDTPVLPEEYPQGAGEERNTIQLRGLREYSSAGINRTLSLL